MSTAPDNDCAPWCPVFAGHAIGSIPLVILFFALGNFCVEGLVESGLKV